MVFIGFKRAYQQCVIVRVIQCNYQNESEMLSPSHHHVDFYFIISFYLFIIFRPSSVFEGNQDTYEDI